jgi:hypothetical protein
VYADNDDQEVAIEEMEDFTDEHKASEEDAPRGRKRRKRRKSKNKQIEQ